MTEMQPEAAIEADDNFVFDGEDVLPDDESTQEQADEGHEDGSDSSPDTDGSQENKIQFSEEQQAIFDKAIGEKVFKLREAERKAEEAERKAKEFEAKLPKDSRPEVPEMPDPFSLSDEEYREKVKQRDDAILKAAEYDSRQKYAQEQEESRKAQAFKAQQEEFAKKVEGYAGRAKTLGVSAQELESAGQKVASYGIDNSLGNYIIANEQGPLITKYLANNITELETLRALDPMSAAVRIATEVAPKAAALKPKVNTAPDPVDAPEKASPAPSKTLKGATFE